MTELLKLAQLCGQATIPDRRVDAAICRIVELPLCFEPDCLPDVLAKIIDRVERGEWDQDPSVPFYTASLDAASALAPTGMAWWLYDYGTGGAQASVAAATGDPDCPLKPGTAVRAYSKTPALALCAAALKARAASCDTRPEGGDVQQAPFTGGAAPNGETPND